MSSVEISYNGSLVSPANPLVASLYPYSADQTPVNAGAVGAASAIAPTLAALAAHTNFLSGFEITGGGATAGSVINATITGLLGGTLTYVIAVPTGATLGIQPLAVHFVPPLRASAVNTAIVLNVPSFGAGNTVSTGAIHGFNQ